MAALHYQGGNAPPPAALARPEAARSNLANGGA